MIAWSHDEACLGSLKKAEGSGLYAIGAAPSTMAYGRQREGHTRTEHTTGGGSGVQMNFHVQRKGLEACLACMLNGLVIAING